MTHGTVSGYRHGCRCDECRLAKRIWTREYRQRKQEKPAEWQGASIRIDATRLRALIDADGRTNEDFCADAGIPLTTLDHTLLRGSTSESTLDKIACALGCHMSQLEVR